MTVIELHAKLGEEIKAGRGDSVMTVVSAKVAIADVYDSSREIGDMAALITQGAGRLPELVLIHVP